MICRLCLSDLSEFVTIFDGPKCHSKFPIAKIIAKYLQIEVHERDRVSNKICKLCCSHLNDFHDFWLHIEKQQQKLQTELECKTFQKDMTELVELGEDGDIKDIPLDEQPINEPYCMQSDLTVEELGTITLLDANMSSNEDLPSMESDSSSISLSSKTKYETIVKKRKSEIFSQKKSTTEGNADDQDIGFGKKLTCAVCGKLSANKYALKKHMYRSHPSEDELKYPCVLCIKRFAKKFLLDELLNWHQEADKRNTCEKCKKGFYSKQELKEHRKSEHAKDVKIICDSCGKTFKCKSGYENHYAAEHLGILRPEAQCPICKIWLKNDKVLYTHMYRHRDENSPKEFQCKICGTVKPSKAKLSRHRRYHHPDKLHKCTLCNKEFKVLIGLEEHMAVHKGQPLYTCCFCPQTFKSHANMYTHKRRIHPNEWVSKKAQLCKAIPPDNAVGLEI